MRRRTAFATIAMTAIAGLTLMGCTADPAGPAPGADADKSVIRIGTNTEVSSWSPLNSVGTAEAWVVNQQFPGLMRLETTNVLAPYVAESYEISPDGLRLKVNLNPDFGWSDGTPITAQDVAFTMDRLVGDKLLTSGTYRDNYDRAEVISDTEVDLIMKSPSYNWAIDVMRSVSVMPKHVFEDVPSIAEFNLAENPDKWVSGGAFALSDIREGQGYTFEPNEHFPFREPGNEQYKSVQFNVYGDMNTMQLALRNGDIDAIAPKIPASSLGALTSDSNIEIAKVEKSAVYAKLTFNVGNDTPLRDKRVRQVISGLIDTEQLIKTVLHGEAVGFVGPMLPIFQEHVPTNFKPYSYTVEEARKILDEAGYGEFSLVMGCNQGDATHSKYTQIIRDALAPVGISVDLQCAERAVSLTNAKASKYDLYVQSYNHSGTEASGLIVQFHPANPAGANYSFFPEEPEMERLLTATQNATTEKDYIAAVQDAAEYVNDEAYILTLFNDSLLFAHRTSPQGYLTHPTEAGSIVTGYSLAQLTK